jgi:hypothetical protein
MAGRVRPIAACASRRRVRNCEPESVPSKSRSSRRATAPRRPRLAAITAKTERLASPLHLLVMSTFGADIGITAVVGQGDCVGAAMLVSPSAGPCKRCLALRAHVQFARTVEPRTGLWTCPNCGMTALPVTNATASESAALDPPTPCPCPLRGPVHLGRAAGPSAQVSEWWWVCDACGFGRRAWHKAWE